MEVLKEKINQKGISDIVVTLVRRIQAYSVNIGIERENKMINSSKRKTSQNVSKKLKHRKRVNRSKNRSIEMNNVIYPDISQNLPDISNTGKLVSKKISCLEKDMKVIENNYTQNKSGGHKQRTNMSYDDVYDNLKGFRKSNKPPSSQFLSRDNSSERNSGIMNYMAVSDLTAANHNKARNSSKQSDVIAPWKINKRSKLSK